MTLIVCRRPPAMPSPARNRTSATWLRARILRLHDELLRAEVYGDRQRTCAEIRRELAAVLAGEERAAK